MHLKAPKFWYEKPTFLMKFLLRPFCWLYSIISTKNYRKKFKYKSTKSCVVAIGAITCGGSGKTIVTQAICEFLKSKGKHVAVLTRGYGRKSKDTFLVNNQLDSYQDTGDEPMLLSKTTDVYVGNDREKSAKIAEKNNNFDVFILDDGLTQRGLHTDLRVVVIDSEQQFGNGELLPLGPNRLDLTTIKNSINLFLIIGKNNIKTITKKLGNSNIFNVNLETSFPTIGKSKNIIAFCGLGFPEKFFNSIKNYFGTDRVKKVYAFPDHYPYKKQDIEKLIAESKEFNAQLITTEKDFLKIHAEYKEQIKTVSVKIEWKEKWLEF